MCTTHLASIAGLAGTRVRLQLALDDVRKVLGPALETRQFELGGREAVGGPIAGVAGPFGWAGLLRRHGARVSATGRSRCAFRWSVDAVPRQHGRRGVGGSGPVN
jgi:hypothetical protein